MFVIGLDLSLTSTGLATKSSTVAIRPKKLTGYPRLRFIRDRVRSTVLQTQPDLVVVEGPSYGSVGAGQHERGGLWWMVTEAIEEYVPIAVAPPANIKKYATGVGGGPRAGKDAVLLAASRRFDWFVGGNDEADALWACALGHDQLGEPLVAMPQENRKALAGVAWPAGHSFSQSAPA